MSKFLCELNHCTVVSWKGGFDDVYFTLNISMQLFRTSKRDILNLVPMLIISVDVSKDRLLKGECACVLSHVRLCDRGGHVRLCDLWTVNLQTPLSTEFSRQGYWIQLPFSSPGTLPNPGIELTSTLTGEFFATEATPRVSK